MKKNIIVKLKTLRENYKLKNLNLNIHGVVLNSTVKFSRVLFFSAYNIGEIAIVKVMNEDLEIEKEKIPDQYLKELLEKLQQINYKEELNSMYIQRLRFC